MRYAGARGTRPQESIAKLCLIPPMFDLRYSATTVTCPPLGFAYVAGSAHSAGHEVHVIHAVGEAPTQVTALSNSPFTTRGLTCDEVLERVPADTDALAVSCTFSQDWPSLRGILSNLCERFPSTPIIGGGEHCTAPPEFSIEDGGFDHRVLGEGEETFVELLDAIQTGRSTTPPPERSLGGFFQRLLGGGDRGANRRVARRSGRTWSTR